MIPARRDQDVAVVVRVLPALAAVVLILLSGGTADGDDTVFYGSAAALYPAKTVDVSLESETVVFTESKDGWDVSAMLVFKNLTGRAVTVKVGFPDNDIPDDRNEVWAQKTYKPATLVKNLSVFIDDRPVKYELVTTSNSASWRQAFIFDITFPPQRRTTIFHTYHIDGFYVSGGTHGVPYILETGANWAGKIKEASFIYRFLSPPVNMKIRYGNTVISPRGDGKPRLQQGEIPFGYKVDYVAGPQPMLTLTFSDFEPLKRADLTVVYATDLIACAI